MRDFVQELRPDLLERAAEIVGDDPFARAEESTRFLQPAVYCASLAGWERYRREGEGAAPDLSDLPDFFAGHSLGELSSLVAAGSLDANDGLRLVALRAELMERAAAAEANGRMLAVMGADAQDFAARAADLDLAVAGDNSPGQVVLSGPTEAVRAAADDAEERGLKAVMLRIAGSFHHPSMQAVVPEYERALAEVRFDPPRAPVLSGVTAQPFPADGIRRLLAQGLRSPVLWRPIALELYGRGVRRYVESGPGRTLIGLLRWTLPDDIEMTTMDAEVTVA